jgi:hypothetical protein
MTPRMGRARGVPPVGTPSGYLVERLGVASAPMRLDPPAACKRALKPLLHPKMHMLVRLFIGAVGVVLDFDANGGEGEAAVAHAAL